MTLASKAKTRVPCAVRVPMPMRRAMTQWRNARSASLLVSGSSGWSSTTQKVSQSLSNSRASARVFSCAGIRLAQAGIEQRVEQGRMAFAQPPGGGAPPRAS